MLNIPQNVYVLITILTAYVSIFNISNFVLGFLPLILYLLFNLILVLGVIILAYEKKRFR